MLADKDEIPGFSEIEMDRDAKASLRILVIDDERTLRESCRTFIETEGYGGRPAQRVAKH